MCGMCFMIKVGTQCELGGGHFKGLVHGTSNGEGKDPAITRLRRGS